MVDNVFDIGNQHKCDFATPSAINTVKPTTPSLVNGLFTVVFRNLIEVLIRLVGLKFFELKIKLKFRLSN